MVKYKDKIYRDVNIAILLATYNGERYIKEQLESITSQTYQKFVCFIHDDNSNDNTGNMVKDFCIEHNEQFVYIGNERCGGAKENFMYMLNVVEADYIMFCDQDDYWLDTKIEKSLNEITKIQTRDEIPVCIYSDVMVVNSDLEVISDSYFKMFGTDGDANTLIDLLKKNVAIGCTMMINKALRDEAIKVKNIDNIYMHDYWCALICSVEGELSCIKEQLVLYRQHDDNVTGAKAKPNFWKRFTNMFSWSQWSGEKKRWINRPRKFAKELINITNSNNAYYNFLKQLSEIEYKNKFNRIIFYIKYNLIKWTSNVFIQLFFI